ncbi:hypothetical protein [Winogradskyella immobilis]
MKFHQNSIFTFEKIKKTCYQKL